MQVHEDSPQSPLDRIFKITGCRTQTELAALLGIRQSSISDAKKRNSIPPEWLVTLFRLRRINPDWVMDGTGPKHLNARDQPSVVETKLSDVPVDETIHQSALRCFSSQDLTDELLRRCRKNVCERPAIHADESSDNEKNE